jgi:hypothetical protein
VTLTLVLAAVLVAMIWLLELAGLPWLVAIGVATVVWGVLVQVGGLALRRARVGMVRLVRKDRARRDDVL